MNKFEQSAQGEDLGGNVTPRALIAHEKSFLLSLQMEKLEQDPGQKMIGGRGFATTRALIADCLEKA